jgi:hypothetical protein
VAFFGVAAAFFTLVKLGADQVAQFALNDAIVLMRVVNDLAADFDILLERLVAGVNHDAGEPLINAVFAQLKGIAVIQVNRDGDIREGDGCFDKFLKVDRVSVFPRAVGDLEHHGRFFLFAGFDDCLEQFHVVDVEGTEGVLALQSFREEVFGMGEGHRGESERVSELVGN